MENYIAPGCHEKCGVEATCFKGAQEQLDSSGNGVSGSRSIQQARAAGFKSNGLYYWDDPGVQVQVLVDYYSRDIDVNNPDFICTDHEQYKNAAGTHYDPGYLSDHGQALCERLQARYPEKRLIPYTAEWYVYGHAPNMTEWLPNFDTWIAWWSDNLQPRYRLTLEQIRDGWLRRTLYKDVSTGYVYNMIRERDQFEDKWPRENIKVVLHQYSSRILLPYSMVGGTVYDHQNDWDYSPLSLDQWIAYTKGETVPTEPFEPYNVKTIPAWLTVKSGPGVTYADVSWLKAGTIVTILEEASGWGRYTGGWINLGYTEKISTPVMTWEQSVDAYLRTLTPPYTGPGPA